VLAGSIFALGVTVRFLHFPDSVFFIGDIARDIMAGELIAKLGMSSLLGHWNSGLGTYYPPYYYYFLSLLHFVFWNNPTHVLAMLVLIASAEIILMYGILKKIVSFQVAVMGTFLYAISSELILIARSPLSAHMSIPIFLLSVYFLSNGSILKKIHFYF